MSDREHMGEGKPRNAIAIGALALLAGVVALFLTQRCSRRADGSLPLHEVRARTDAARDTESVLEVTTPFAHSRSVAAPPGLGEASPNSRSSEPFPTVILGSVVVAGGRPGDGAGTRVRCTPSLGQVVDCIVDENDRFEVRGIAGGRVRFSCKREGLWARDADLFVDESEPGASVSITLHPVWTVRVWVDDTAGRVIECKEDNVYLLERLQACVSTSRERIGEALLDSRLARGTISQETSRAFRALQYPGSEAPPADAANEPLYTFQLTETPDAHLTLTLSGLVVDSVPIPPGASDVRMRFDPRVLDGRLAEIEVRVLREDTESPLSGALVQVSREDIPIPWISAHTDVNGTAVVPFLERGTYRVVAQHEDCVQAACLVEIAHAVGTVRTQLRLLPGVSIAGRIDWGSTPGELQFASVTCRLIEGRLGFSVTTPRRTDPTRGEFEFRGLEPGVYKIGMRSGPDGRHDTVIEADVRTSSVRDVVLKPK